MVMIGNRQITISLHKTVFLMDKLVDRMLLGSLDLTLAQFLILMAIRRSDKVSQKKIANFWEMTEAAVSRQIELLVGKKLVLRKENLKNRREHILSLTKEGVGLITKALKVWDEVSAKIYKGIGAGERSVLIRALDKLLKILCKNNPDLKMKKI